MDTHSISLTKKDNHGLSACGQCEHLKSVNAELLEALNGFVTVFDMPNYDEDHMDALERCLEAARAAIAKATGEQQCPSTP